MGVPKTLRIGMRDPEVRFLHALLNYQLPWPDDQLPLAGPEAMDFGPVMKGGLARTVNDVLAAGLEFARAGRDFEITPLIACEQYSLKSLGDRPPLLNSQIRVAR